MIKDEKTPVPIYEPLYILEAHCWEYLGLSIAFDWDGYGADKLPFSTRAWRSSS